MSNKIAKHKHAIVIGCSMAGLLAARALSDSFEKVTILERDPVQPVPESRKGQPQTRHVHGLLAPGLLIFNEYFPGIEAEMVTAGALSGDMAQAFHWHCEGGYRLQFDSGLAGMTMSRPFLEFHIRRRALAVPNITLLDSCSVKALITSPDRRQVQGVLMNRRDEENETETLLADLIVDASGRGSSTPKWLEGLGYERPQETEVKIRVSYATREYRRTIKGPGIIYLEMISPRAPQEKRGAFLFPVEGDRWILTAGSYVGDHIPATEDGLMEYIRNLPASNIYDVISKAEPLSEVLTYKYPSSLRRHYEKLKRFPENYLVMGDAAGSMNPIYGQGMTSAAMQSKVLQRTVQQSDLQGIWKTYFKEIARVIDIPWQLTVGEDFRYPETEGVKPPFIDLINAYVSKAHRATHRDPVVYKQFLRVMNLMDPPASLMSPAIFWRVLFKG
jgi:2-polyprenyl-6-methoxyphenol hydroxylase-like FAD-dependent oxidoreductase